MAQSVLELAVKTGKWDAGLKEAQKALNNFTQSQGGLQQALQKDGDKVKQFVEMMGKATSQAKTARGQMNEYKATVEQLTRSYNSLSDSEKKVFGQSFQHTIDQVTQKFRSAQDEMKRLNDSMNVSSSSSGAGGLLSGMSLTKFAGTIGLATSAADILTGALTSAVDRARELVTEGVDMARSGEGIIHAFEALNRPDLLQGLREATHGTVSDLELMKAAVQANDFRIPLENLGKYMEFAQLKASETGQSVDFLTQSIVTGLGRQSKQILDNLGISAAELTEKMNNGATMAEAVGQIIDTQLAAAGDHFETAAERAGRAATDLANAQMELGKTLLPMWDEASGALTAIETKALRATNVIVKSAQEGGVAWDIFFGSLKTSALSALGPLGKVINTMLDIKNIASGLFSSNGGMNAIEMDNSKEQANKKRLDALMAGDIASRNKVTPPKTPRGGRRGGRTTPRVTTKTEEVLPVGSVAALNKELADLRKQQSLATDTAGWDAQQVKIDELTSKIKILKGEIPDPNKIQDPKKLGASTVIGLGTWQSELDNVQEQLKAMLPDGGIKIPVKLDINTDQGSLAKEGKNIGETWKLAASAVQSVGSALQSVEDPSVRIAGMIGSAIANIALGFAEASAKEGKGGVWYWLAATAAGLATMISTISAIHSSTGYAEGGIVKGNQYSGDNIPGGAMINAGELVLNRAQQGNLAAQLQEGGGGYTPSHISGEQIFIALNRYTKRSGKGELVMWR